MSEVARDCKELSGAAGDFRDRRGLPKIVRTVRASQGLSGSGKAEDDSDHSGKNDKRDGMDLGEDFLPCENNNSQ